jgi:hypothetical protein
MDDNEYVIYDENDIEDFEDFCRWNGIDDIDDIDYDDDVIETDIRELYF